MSADTAEVQRRFVDKYGLEFPLVPDPEKRIIDSYGAREVVGVTARRRTFLVGPDGRIAHVWPKVIVEGHADDVLAVLRALADPQEA